MDYKQKYDSWLKSDYFDEATKVELEAIKNDEKEIEDRFYKDLEFGTGGLRGVIGAGSNRINIYTVRKATQGLANYLLNDDVDSKNKGVAIAYDSRRMSPEFAKETALVFNGNGIKTYLFESLRPTPELSFAVRELGCKAGIVITASHNPAEYNGYKVYWEDGCQVPPPRDGEIITEVDKIEDFEVIKCMDESEAISTGLLNIIGKAVDDRFIDEVKKQTLNQQVIDKMADKLSIVYTPLHGTGNKPVRRILDELGYKNVNIVKEQEMPDPNFSTIDYPNPEDPKAFKLALELAKEKDADVIIGTDPDADRVGVLVKDDTEEYVVLTGNMTGVLLADYIICQLKEKGQLADNAALIKTIVTTEMARAIAEYHNIALIEVLTGFKYIGEKIGQFEANKDYTYLFGFEESYGYLAGTYARDKDAVVASMLVCEMAAYYKEQGMTLYEALQSVYKKYGYYKETLKSLTLKGLEGIAKIELILKEFRENAPQEFAGLKVIDVIDYLSPTTGLPKSNVLYFKLENNSWFCVRPSGTEPKVKFYFGVKGSNNKDSDTKLDLLANEVMEKVEEIIK